MKGGGRKNGSASLGMRLLGARDAGDGDEDGYRADPERSVVGGRPKLDEVDGRERESRVNGNVGD